MKSYVYPKDITLTTHAKGLEFSSPSHLSIESMILNYTV